MQGWVYKRVVRASVGLGVGVAIALLSTVSASHAAVPSSPKLLKSSPVLRQLPEQDHHQQTDELAPLRPEVACPSDLENLTKVMLRDLPGYANRVSQRAFDRIQTRTSNVPGYVIIASQPEFAPLTLGPGVYEPSTYDNDDPYQIFFTTLERQYVQGRAVQLQHYHWLFLTQTNSGWRLALMFSRTGTYPTIQPPTPPRDSSQGVIAQAIRIWLNDCQTGNIQPW